MKTVAEILKQKPAEVVSIAPQATVLEALQLLAKKEIGAVLVMEGERLVGILSERDYTRKIALQGKSSTNTPVSEIMTRDVVCVTPGHSNEECMALMTDRHARHLPVMLGERVVGVVSIGDLVKDLLSEQQFIIKQLESYIHG